MARTENSIRRYAKLIAITLVVGSMAPFVPILFELGWMLPRTVREHPVPWTCLILAVSAEGCRRFSRAPRICWAIAALDRLASWLLNGGYRAILIALIAAMLGTWLPHYLTWPWHRDVDTFAVLARSWDDGVLPYRDIRAYNFPGHIYLHWLIGKLAGWGHASVFYAVDGTLLIALCVVLAAWSHRRFSSIAPGLIASIAFVAFYLHFGYEIVAERDAHTPILMAISLLIAEGWPGLRGWSISAILAAMALTIRPQAILFLPAIALAVALGAQSRKLRAVLVWGLFFSAFSILAFAPILVAGIADDLVSGLRVASYGGPYSRATPGVFLKVLGSELIGGGVVAILVANGLLIGLGSGPGRRSAMTWSVALVGAILYRPLSPVQHPYLIHPQALFSAIAIAPPIAWLLAQSKVSGLVRVLALTAVLFELVHGIPGQCRPGACLPAIKALMRGEATIKEPSGSFPGFDASIGRPYPWAKIVALSRYLREHTSPTTFVANVLKEPPFPSINGPVGRPSPFLAESGITWMWLVDIDLDDEFAPQLESAGDSVVVWAPIEVGHQARLRLPKLTEVILRNYRFEAAFGRIEVWRRMVSPKRAVSIDGEKRD